MSQIEIRHVRKSYGNVDAVKNSHLTIGKGEFFSLLGPSGCGKTTTLRMIAGFVAPTAGQILIGGKDVTGLAPERRNIGIVFQNYAIFPHMNVAQNIGYGLKLRRMPKTEIAEKVKAALTRVGLAGYEERSSTQLSGGEQQRVALARVIVLEPSLLLLDEPLSALDKRLRDEMRVWLKDLQNELGITTVYVTHDQDEALSLSDRIAVMNQGTVHQIGTPTEIYERPSTRFVADFIGESNLMPARLVGKNAEHAKIELDGGLVCHGRLGSTRGSAGDRMTLMVRPEQIIVDAPDDAAINRFDGVLDSASYHGSIIRFQIRLESGLTLRGERPNLGHNDMKIGQRIAIGWHRDHSVLLDEVE